MQTSQLIVNIRKRCVSWELIIFQQEPKMMVTFFLLVESFSLRKNIKTPLFLYSSQQIINIILSKFFDCMENRAGAG